MVGRVASPRVVGRRAEFDVLVGALSRARTGAGSVVLIGGDAGIGKSRLTAALGERAQQDGAAVLIGECLPLGDGELPYGPIVGVLRAVGRERGRDGLIALATAGHDELARLLPDFGAPPNQAGSQALLFEQLLAVLTNVARVTPLLLVIEDLHWSDRATRDFLAFLSRAIRSEPILLAATYRSDEVVRKEHARAFVHELERSGRAARIELRPLGRAEVAEQITAILGAAPGPALVDTLYARAEGNPFFTEELLASRPDGELPDSLRHGLLLRLAGCSADVAGVVRALAVEGKQIEHDLLERVLGLPADRLTAALREAIDRDVIVTVPGANRYGFRHALLCEVAYADLLPAERRATHAALAAAISADLALGGTQAAATAKVAQHWRAAGEQHLAFSAAVRAASEAERIYASDEALIHYDAILDLWSSVADGCPDVTVTRGTVLQWASAAAAHAGDPTRAIELAREALADFGGADAAEQARAHANLGRRLWDAGRGIEALPEYRRAVRLTPTEATADLAAALAGEAQMLMLAQQLADSVERAGQALALALSAGARNVQANVLNTIAATASFCGRPRDGIAAAAQARAIARELGLLDELGRGYINGGYALEQAGRLPEAITLTETGLEVCASIGGEKKFGVCLRSEIAERALRIGDWNRTEAMLEELREVEPAGLNAHNVFDVRALLLALRGDPTAGAGTAAARAVAEAHAFAARTGGRTWPAILGEAQATYELWAGAPAAAAATLAAGLEASGAGASIVVTARLYALAVRAIAERALSGADLAALAAEAEALLADFDAQIRRLDEGPTSIVRAARQTAEAELSRFTSADPDAWHAAAASWDAHHDPYQAAYARWREAEAILATHGGRGRPEDRAAAEQAAAAAYETARRLGARPLADAITGLARRARLEIGLSPLVSDAAGAEPDAIDAYALTPREREVLALIGEGMTNRAIAAELVITEKTASVHVSRILAKLSVGNRASAAVAAQRLGVVRAPAPHA